MPRFKEVQLGKAPAKYDPRTPKLSDHKLASMPAPASSDRISRVPKNAWGLWGNDSLGNCTAVGVGNAFVGWTAYAHGTPLSITTNEVTKFYSETTGYVPGDPSTDQGGVELDVLKYLATKGFDAGRSKPETALFAQFDPSDTNAMKNAIAHLGVAYLGIQLPLSAQSQTVWTLTNGADGDDTPGSWGGHCVVAKAYDANYVRLITWGTIQVATWSWLKRYMDEGYGLLSEDWLNRSGHSPEGLNWDRLQADLKALTG